MIEMKYCYACRVHHDATTMATVQTRRGSRWRCKETIRAARAPAATRDSFGKMQTEMNKQATKYGASLSAELNRYRLDSQFL